MEGSCSGRIKKRGLLTGGNVQLRLMGYKTLSYPSGHSQGQRNFGDFIDGTLKHSSVRDNGPKTAEKMCSSWTWGWDRIVLLRWHTTLNCRIRLSWIRHRIQCQDSFMNSFKNTGDTHAVGSSLEQSQKPTKAFCTTSGLLLPRFTCEVSKNCMRLHYFPRRELFWFWNIWV